MCSLKAQVGPLSLPMSINLGLLWFTPSRCKCEAFFVFIVTQLLTNIWPSLAGFMFLAWVLVGWGVFYYLQNPSTKIQLFIQSLHWREVSKQEEHPASPQIKSLRALLCKPSNRHLRVLARLPLADPHSAAECILKTHYWRTKSIPLDFLSVLPVNRERERRT